MNPLALFQQHRAEFRGRPVAGFTVEVFPDLCRGTAQNAGEEGWIGFAQLDPESAGARIDEQVRYFARLSQAFEWKLFDFDTPASLRALLEARGFGCDEPEAFLVLDLESWTDDRSAAPPVRLEQLHDDDGLRDFVAVQEAVWERSLPTDFARYRRELQATPDVTSFYCAYCDDQPVAAGRIEFPAGRSFASLWAGSVRPTMRGRGVYSALLAARLAEAKARGYRFVTVDAAPMSRPILLRKGFQHICWTYPMRLRT
ncbi:MAG: GNAT family N-acetyltransferase [Opitutaceae bacterium]|nr:GNAT family N-acetyltransferase [Opitutaceae bacterium]